jgi:hypothetical protein
VECVGDVFPLFGASNGGKQQKNREMGWALAIDGCRLNFLHTTTNQKQASATEGTMKGRRDKREARGKHASTATELAGNKRSGLRC